MATERPQVEQVVRCGIAGWSYDDWNGYVYPAGVKDKLRYAAQFVDVIEINSTFYRPPAARMAASWAARTADLPDFTFTAKLHQDITHRGRWAPELNREIREGLAPLVDAGRLAHILAQFRYDFADTPANRQLLARIHGEFGGLANIVFELRHDSWEQPEALALLKTPGVSVAHLDYPLAHNSFKAWAHGVGEHAYLRLHGRNAEAWFNRKAGRDETYNYLYGKDEMKQIVERASKIASMSKSLTLIANNHFRGKEMVNALEARAKLLGRKVSVPPELLKQYPRLKEVLAEGNHE
jgi:uncharacterized protein YecE (DUF72 family)